MLLESVKKKRRKSEVALHELFWSLRSVYACEVEDEVAVLAITVKVIKGGVLVVFIDCFEIPGQAGNDALAFLYVVELGAEVLAYETFGTCY